MSDVGETSERGDPRKDHNDQTTSWTESEKAASTTRLMTWPVAPATSWMLPSPRPFYCCTRTAVARYETELGCERHSRADARRQFKVRQVCKT